MSQPRNLPGAPRPEHRVAALERRLALLEKALRDPGGNRQRALAPGEAPPRTEHEPKPGTWDTATGQAVCRYCQLDIRHAGPGQQNSARGWESDNGSTRCLARAAGAPARDDD